MSISNSDTQQIKRMVVGGIAGVISRTITAPIELYKIQRQNSYMENATIKDVLKNEGICGLWKGNLTNVIRIFPQTGINYMIYKSVYESKLLKNKFDNYNYNHNHNHKNDSYRQMISGMMGGIISTVCIYPLETIRSRLSLQTNNNHYNGIMDAIKKMKVNELYRGISIGLLGFVPFNTLNFVIFHDIKNRMMQVNNRKEENRKISNVFIYMISGGIAGMGSVSITYPTDVVRRRLHLQGFDKNVPKYDGIIDCIRKIYKVEGIYGYYRGLGACYMKLFPAVSIQFTIMEYLNENKYIV
jgi:solute carrier family 25 phosphate transporter 23/24/25/41